MAYGCSNPRNDLTAEYVASRISFEPTTGKIYWKPRLGRGPIIKMWNTRFAGKEITHKNTTGHIQLSLDGHNYLGHRLAWLFHYGRWPAGYIDHVNGDRADNRIDNLREATPSQNAVNSKPRKNQSGYRGVYEFRGRWAARCKFAGSDNFLGYFNCPTKAAIEYRKAIKEIASEFVPSHLSGRA